MKVIIITAIVITNTKFRQFIIVWFIPKSKNKKVTYLVLTIKFYKRAISKKKYMKTYTSYLLLYLLDFFIIIYFHNYFLDTIFFTSSYKSLDIFFINLLFDLFLSFFYKNFKSFLRKLKLLL